MKRSISFLIVVHNEADLLEGRLRQVDPYVDEIVVVHDGEPEDESVNIARRFTDQVIVAPYQGYCEPQRQVGLEQCRADWVLVGDADEVFAVEFLRSLYQKARQAEKAGCDGIVLNRHEFNLGPNEISEQLRFFRREAGYFTDIIHTNVSGIDKKLRLEGVQLVHYSRTDGPTADRLALAEKTRRYAAVQERLREKYQDDPQVLEHLSVNYQLPDMRLTLLTAVRNEGQSIGAFLARHASAFDEVIVVHDGECMDQTLYIAAQYDNVRGFERPGRHNPFPHREWALRNVIYGGWVAVFDPDESLSDGLLQDMRKLVDKAEAQGMDGIAVTMMPYLDEVGLEPHAVWRIFKRSDQVHYPDHPHAGIEGLTNGLVAEEYTFTHLNRAQDIPSKVRRRDAILRRKLREEPDSPRRESWLAGMRMTEDWQRVMDQKGISLEVEGQGLAGVEGIDATLAARLSEELGLVTREEFIAGDAGYIAQTVGLDIGRVRQLQYEAGGEW